MGQDFQEKDEELKKLLGQEDLVNGEVAIFLARNGDFASSIIESNGEQYISDIIKKSVSNVDVKNLSIFTDYTSKSNSTIARLIFFELIKDNRLDISSLENMVYVSPSYNQGQIIEAIKCLSANNIIEITLDEMGHCHALSLIYATSFLGVVKNFNESFIHKQIDKLLSFSKTISDAREEDKQSVIGVIKNKINEPFDKDLILFLDSFYALQRLHMLLNHATEEDAKAFIDLETNKVFPFLLTDATDENDALLSILKPNETYILRHSLIDGRGGHAVVLNVVSPGKFRFYDANFGEIIETTDLNIVKFYLKETLAYMAKKLHVNTLLPHVFLCEQLVSVERNRETKAQDIIVKNDGLKAYAENLIKNPSCLETKSAVSKITILICAVQNKMVDFVEAVLKHKDSISAEAINAKDDDDMSAIAFACKNGDTELAKCLSSHKDINRTGEGLMNAILYDSPEVVMELLKNSNVNPNTRPEDCDISPLGFAAREDNFGIVKILLNDPRTELDDSITQDLSDGMNKLLTSQHQQPLLAHLSQTNPILSNGSNRFLGLQE